MAEGSEKKRYNIGQVGMVYLVKIVTHAAERSRQRYEAGQVHGASHNNRIAIHRVYGRRQIPKLRFGITHGWHRTRR